ncbi:hypothetical protein FRC06_010545 [Ceratobasidium sp. 370]|nr:hypothetical protein FRC06_010545 [Ceratobasidium sp. 370]
MYYGACALCTSVRGLTIRPGIVSRSIETIEVASEDICGVVPAMDVANSPADRNRGSGLPTSEPPPISISNSSIGADEDDPPRLSYFDKGKWPEVDINEARRELARTGAPMMARNPTLARTSTAPPLPEAVLVLDIPDGHPAELPKVDPSPRLDDVARALLSSCDEFGCVVDEGWTDESDGRSFSRSGAPSPDLAPRSPVVSDAESDAAHVLPSFGSAQSAGEVDGKAGDVKKQARWRDEKGGGLERGRAEVTGQLERPARAARAKVRPVSIPRRAGRG